MPPTCVIRFIDQDDDSAYIRRSSHGLPEEVITNLAHLQSFTQKTGGDLTAGTVAADFLFVDMLWYAIQEMQLENFGDDLLRLIESPKESDTDGYSFLDHHSVLDSTSPVDDVSYLYMVEIGNGTSDWTISISHESDSVSGTVNRVFRDATWLFSGPLLEAELRFS